MNWTLSFGFNVNVIVVFKDCLKTPELTNAVN